jgi:non-ribosomal peptide synthetase-like protein
VLYRHNRILEWDLIEIGDRTTIGEDAVMQTHLFEDRILKASNFRIGDDCSVGASSVVLYNTTMHSGSQLDSLSLLMKGEVLPPRTEWRGIPALSKESEETGNQKEESLIHKLSA